MKETLKHFAIGCLIGLLLGAPLLLHAGSKVTVGGMTVENNTITVGGLPAGGIIMWGKTALPSGWLLCDGTAYNNASYPALYAAIGTSYNRGGEAANTFRVPDGRGLFPQGAGQSGVYGANYAGTLGGYGQDAQLTTGHAHSWGSSVGNKGERLAAGRGYPYGNSGWFSAQRYSGGDDWGDEFTVGGSTSSGGDGARIAAVVRPASFGVNYIIKY